jgi:MFS family permease
MVTQLLQNVDSTGLGYASVWGLTKDLKISTVQYTWVGSMPFFGYLFFEWPMSFVAQRFHTGRVVGVVVFFWGLTLMGTSITQNFAGLVSVRFILGALMSVTSPAWVLITSIFYRREEQAFRVMFWWSMNGLSLAVGGIISFCCGYIKVNNIPSWKWSESTFLSLVL